MNAMKAKYDTLKSVHTRFSQANALVASAKERGEVTGEKHRVSAGGMQSTVVTLADVSKMTPEQLDGLKKAIKIVNAGWNAQNVLGFKFADFAEIARDHEKLEARIVALESGGPKEVPRAERAADRKQA